MANSRSVYILSKIPGLSKAVSSRLPHVNIINIHDRGNDLSSSEMESLMNAEVMLADPGAMSRHHLVQRLPKLQWMQSTWAGVDHMIKALDKSKPLPEYMLTRFAAFFGPPMTEYILGQMIARERNFEGMKTDQRACEWTTDKHSQFRELSTLTLGVLGVGDIGRHIAKMAKAFGMKVWGLVSTLPGQPNQPNHDCVDVFRDRSGLEELLRECDYVCNILPHTPATVGLLDGDILQHCSHKKTVFINIGRGSVVKNETIVKALGQGWLGHAILDVLEEEPLAPDSPLWNHPHVTITPHVSGISRPEPVADIFVENYQRFLEQKELRFVVNWEKGY